MLAGQALVVAAGTAASARHVARTCRTLDNRHFHTSDQVLVVAGDVCHGSSLVVCLATIRIGLGVVLKAGSMVG